MFISLWTKGTVSSNQGRWKFNEIIRNLPALEYLFIRQSKSCLIESHLIYHLGDGESVVRVFSYNFIEQRGKRKARETLLYAESKPLYSGNSVAIVYLHFCLFLFRHYTQRCIVSWSKTALADSHGVNHQSYAFHPQQQFREKTALYSPLAAGSADCWLFLWCKPLCLQIQTPRVGRGCPCTPQLVPLPPGIDAEKTKEERNWNFPSLGGLKWIVQYKQAWIEMWSQY